jgi:competence protein ComGC
MDLIYSLILLIIVIILIVLFVAEPLTSRQRIKVQDSQALSTLLAERDRVLNILKELDFDASLDKIPAETYSIQRASLVQQGAEILRKIDQLPPVLPAAPAVAAVNEDRVEAVLSARRARRPAAVVDEDKMESLVASRHTVRAGKSGPFCSHCGRALSSSDRFCSGCGHPVQ